MAPLVPPEDGKHSARCRPDCHDPLLGLEFVVRSTLAESGISLLSSDRDLAGGISRAGGICEPSTASSNYVTGSISGGGFPNKSNKAATRMGPDCSQKFFRVLVGYIHSSAAKSKTLSQKYFK